MLYLRKYISFKYAIFFYYFQYMYSAISSFLWRIKIYWICCWRRSATLRALRIFITFQAGLCLKAFIVLVFVVLISAKSLNWNVFLLKKELQWCEKKNSQYTAHTCTYQYDFISFHCLKNSLFFSFWKLFDLMITTKN